MRHKLYLFFVLDLLLLRVRAVLCRGVLLGWGVQVADILLLSLPLQILLQSGEADSFSATSSSELSALSVGRQNSSLN
jgi:hypothetical protein